MNSGLVSCGGRCKQQSKDSKNLFKVGRKNGAILSDRPILMTLSHSTLRPLPGNAATA